LPVELSERRKIVGGTAVTEGFAPGLRNSSASDTVSLLHPRIIRERSMTFSLAAPASHPIIGSRPIC
jgi:hypothetical protein